MSLKVLQPVELHPWRAFTSLAFWWNFAPPSMDVPFSAAVHDLVWATMQKGRHFASVQHEQTALIWKQHIYIYLYTKYTFVYIFLILIIICIWFCSNCLMIETRTNRLIFSQIIPSFTALGLASTSANVYCRALPASLSCWWIRPGVGRHPLGGPRDVRCGCFFFSTSKIYDTPRKSHGFPPGKWWDWKIWSFQNWVWGTFFGGRTVKLLGGNSLFISWILLVDV